MPKTPYFDRNAPDKHGIYIGTNTKLIDKTAILKEIPMILDNSEYFKVQFDNIDTGLGFGWHRFHKSDFQVDEDYGK